jgi:hypothetical protein
MSTHVNRTLRNRLEWIDAQMFAILQDKDCQGVLDRDDRRALESLARERRQLSDALAREERINA